MPPWVYNPHAGGSKIPEKLKEPTRRRILAHAEKHYTGRFTRLDIRFRGALCYIDAYREPRVTGKPWVATRETRDEFMDRLRNTPLHMCRLRYSALKDEWSVAFFAYSSEKYEPSFFASGEMMGTPEEGFDVGAVYLD